MLIASISEAKNRLSALLDRVRAGESVVIADRGVPIARLEPIVSSTEDPDGRLARLERAGTVRTGDGGPADLIGTNPPRARGSAMAALLEERRAAR